MVLCLPFSVLLIDHVLLLSASLYAWRVRRAYVICAILCVLFTFWHFTATRCLPREFILSCITLSLSSVDIYIVYCELCTTGELMSLHCALFVFGYCETIARDTPIGMSAEAEEKPVSVFIYLFELGKIME